MTKIDRLDLRPIPEPEPWDWPVFPVAVANWVNGSLWQPSVKFYWTQVPIVPPLYSDGRMVEGVWIYGNCTVPATTQIQIPRLPSRWMRLLHWFGLA